MKIQLTDEEWMSLIDGTREDGLQICCANVSELRDELIYVARHGGEVDDFHIDRLKMAVGWVEDSHEIDDIPAFTKVRAQLGITSQPHRADKHGEIQ